jgi:hypothetical protein
MGLVGLWVVLLSGCGSSLAQNGHPSGTAPAIGSQLDPTTTSSTLPSSVDSLLSIAIACSSAVKSAATAMSMVSANPTAYPVQQIQATVAPLVGGLATTNSQVQALLPDLPRVPARAARLLSHGLVVAQTAFQDSTDLTHDTAAGAGGTAPSAVAENAQRVNLADAYNIDLSRLESALANFVGLLAHDPEVPPSTFAQIYTP